MTAETAQQPHAGEQPTGGRGAQVPDAGQPRSRESPAPVEQSHKEGDHEILSDLSESVVQTGREVLGQEGLRPLLDVTLDGLFSESARRAIQKQAEEALRSLLETTTDAIPDSYRGGELESQLAQTEQTARTALRESLDAIFNGSARAELQQHLEHALEEALNGTGDAARQQVEQALQSFLLQVVGVFQRHWEQLLRMLLPLITKALQQALAAKAREGSRLSWPRPASRRSGRQVRWKTRSRRRERSSASTWARRLMACGSASATRETSCRSGSGRHSKSQAKESVSRAGSPGAHRQDLHDIAHWGVRRRSAHLRARGAGDSSLPADLPSQRFNARSVL